MRLFSGRSIVHMAIFQIFPRYFQDPDTRFLFVGGGVQKTKKHRETAFLRAEILKLFALVSSFSRLFIADKPHSLVSFFLGGSYVRYSVVYYFTTDLASCKNLQAWNCFGSSKITEGDRYRQKNVSGTPSSIVTIRRTYFSKYK